MDFDQIVSWAAGLPVTMPAVEAVTGKLAADDVLPAAERAAELLEPDAATLILLSGLTRGVAPPAEFTAGLLPWIDDLRHALLLMAQSSGDRVAAILKECESERLSHDREAAMLLLASLLVDEGAAPRTLKVRIRRLARQSLHLPSGVVLGHAALQVDDPDVEQVARRWVEAAAGPRGEGIPKDILEYQTRRAREVVPDQPPEEVEGGFTIKRDAAKVGRNEPCPCGSGKKFKKCCGRPGRGGGPTAVRPRPLVSPYSPTMTEEQFDDIRPMNLRRLDPSTVADRHLVSLLGGLTTYAFWAEAEAAAEEMTRREESFPHVAEFRRELFRDALGAGRADVAGRQLEHLPEDLVDDLDFLNLDLIEQPGGVLRKIEATAAWGLEYPDDGRLIELSHALLIRFPALGILVARGALDTQHRLDAWVMLESIEHARDRLLLPPGDPFWEVWERLLDIDDDAETERAVTEENEELREQVAELRARLSEESGKARRIEHQMEEAMRSVRRQLPALQPDSEPEASTEPIDPEKHAALVARVKEMKTLLRESAHQKSRLRSKLSATSRELEQKEQRALAAPAESPDNDPELEVPADPPGASVRLPEWTTRFEHGLKDVPEHVVRKALTTAAELGAGAQNVWTGIKQMRGVPDVRTARLGLSWRLLFTVDDDRNRLKILEVTHRRDMERALKRYA